MAEQVVKISAADYNKMKRNIERIGKQAEVDNMISEGQAAELLGCSVRSLQNKVSAGDMEGLYVVSPVMGKRFYYKDKLIGIKPIL